MHPTDRHIYLASRSSRRRELLKQIGVSFEVLLLREGPQRAADFDETPLPGESPATMCCAWRRPKPRRAGRGSEQRRLMRFPVLSADTTVALDGEILGKPADREQAVSIPARSSPARPTRYTRAVAVKFDNQLEVALSTTEVQFRDLDEQRSASTSPAASRWTRPARYAIQGRAAVFMRAIAGSYSGVMGLPLYETSQLLAQVRLRAPS